MNYLVHLSLSYPVESLVTGNFIGDLITRKEESNIKLHIQEGVRLHRWIDVYSNQHEALHQINKIFHPYIHKYAPVATDIVCDFVLADNWSNHMSDDFSFFTEFNYRTLLENLHDIPERIQTLCLNMIKNDWLRTYGDFDNLAYVLSRMEKKTKYPVDLKQIAKISEENYSSISNLFKIFIEDCKMEFKENFILQNEKKW